MKKLEFGTKYPAHLPVEKALGLYARALRVTEAMAPVLGWKPMARAMERVEYVELDANGASTEHVGEVFTSGWLVGTGSTAFRLSLVAGSGVIPRTEVETWRALSPLDAHAGVCLVLAALNAGVFDGRLRVQDDRGMYEHMQFSDNAIGHALAISGQSDQALYRLLCAARAAGGVAIAAGSVH